MEPDHAHPVPPLPARIRDRSLPLSRAPARGRFLDFLDPPTRAHTRAGGWAVRRAAARASDPNALVSRFFARAGSQPRDHLRNFSPRSDSLERSWRPPCSRRPHPAAGGAPRAGGPTDRGGGLPEVGQVQRVRRHGGSTITNAREGCWARAESASPRCCTERRRQPHDHPRVPPRAAAHRPTGGRGVGIARPNRPGPVAVSSAHACSEKRTGGHLLERSTSTNDPHASDSPRMSLPWGCLPSSSRPARRGAGTPYPRIPLF
jgi:hypothetical protein